MHPKVSKTEAKKLITAVHGTGNYHLKLSGKKGINIPITLTKAQENRIQRGGKEITLSRKQLNGLKSGGFIQFLPMALGAIGSLLKGKGMEGSPSGGKLVYPVFEQAGAGGQPFLKFLKNILIGFSDSGSGISDADKKEIQALVSKLPAKN